MKNSTLNKKVCLVFTLLDINQTVFRWQVPEHLTENKIMKEVKERRKISTQNRKGKKRKEEKKHTQKSELPGHGKARVVT